MVAATPETSMVSLVAPRVIVIFKSAGLIEHYVDLLDRCLRNRRSLRRFYKCLLASSRNDIHPCRCWW